MVTLLVVDREPQSSQRVASFFGTRGFQVLQAHDSRAALQCIRQEHPNLVVLTMDRPDPAVVGLLKEAQAVNGTIPVIAVMEAVDADVIARVTSLGVVDYLVKPILLDALHAKVVRAVSASIVAAPTAVQPPVGQAGEAPSVVRGIVAALSMILSKIDPYFTHEHVSRSRAYALQLIARLRQRGVLGDAVSDELLLAGVALHDLGKICTPKEILFKPGPLTNEEWRVMRRHPIDGAEIVQQMDSMQAVAQIIRYHQEAYDGSGYPEGLKGEQIPVGARIAAVVDALDAMLADRPYRRGMPLEQVIEEFQRNRGTQFDPLVVDALVSLHADGTLKLCSAEELHSHSGIE